MYVALDAIIYSCLRFPACKNKLKQVTLHLKMKFALDEDGEMFLLFNLECLTHQFQKLWFLSNEGEARFRNGSHAFHVLFSRLLRIPSLGVLKLTSLDLGMVQSGFMYLSHAIHVVS